MLIDRLVGSSLAAVDTLAALAEPGNSDPTRLTAAKATLEHTSRHLAVADISQRLGEIEERVGIDATKQFS